MLKFAIPVLALAALNGYAQPGQPAPMQQTYSMQDSNLKPALPGALKGVGIDQRLDAQIPLNLTFKDEAGRDLPLSTYFTGKKPVIFALVYYRCPMLCSEILNGLAGALKVVTLNPGRDFEVVAVSFDPKDTPEIYAVNTNGNWFLTQPVAYPAQTSAIEALLTALQKLKPAQTLSASEISQNHDANSQMGFNSPTASLSFQFPTLPPGSYCRRQ